MSAVVQWNPAGEHAQDELHIVQAYLTVLADLVTPSRDLHIVDREALAVAMGDLIRRQSAALARMS